MNGKKSILKLSSFFLLAGLALCGQAWGSGAVWDLTSYTYYVEQIAQYSEQINEMKEMVSTSKKTLESAEDAVETANKTYDQLTGTYYKAERYLDRFNRIDQMFDQNPRSLGGQYSKWMRIGKEGTDLAYDSLDLYEDPEKALEITFRDPRDLLYNHLDEMDKRFEITQNAYKNSISEATSVLAGTQARRDNLKTVMGDIKNADGVKEAIDQTNTMLGEVLLILDELLVVTAHMAEAEGLLAYSGVDPGRTDERVEIITTKEDRKTQREQSIKKTLRNKMLENQRDTYKPINLEEI